MWPKVVLCVFVGLGVVTSLVLGVVLLSGTAAAQTATAPIVRPPSRSYSVTLVGDQGERLRTFQHQGRTFVLGRLGERYGVRVANPSDERVEAVITVDGRDAVTGRVGDYVSGRGYVIAPHDSVLVEGFRQSLESVATFRFSHPAESYSARMGTPENVGVIGVAFFPERRRPIIALPRPAAPAGEARRAPARAKASAAPAPPREEFRLGTEYGESRSSTVHGVSFERADPTHPARVIVLHYDDAEGLEARGIRVFGDKPWWQPKPTSPDPFPAARFAPPPP
jgi:hypothetical protein